MYTIEKLMPNLMVEDIAKSVHFYVETLGFTFKMAVSESKETHTALQEGTNYIWAHIAHGETEIMFQRTDSLHEDIPFMELQTPQASVSFYFRLDQVEALYTACKDKINILKPLETAWYGMKEFYIKDNNGYILCFGAPDPDFSHDG